MRVPTGTWVDIRPIHFIFSPVSGWKAESYSTLAIHALSRENSGGSVPSLKHSTGGEEQDGKGENVYGASRQVVVKWLGKLCLHEVTF